MSVVRHMLYESFGTQKTMVTFISKFDPRKDHFEVKLGQNSKFSYKIMLILSSFVSGFQKCDLFLRPTIRNAKNRVSKRDVVIITFFTIAQLIIKILLWNLACMLFVCSFTTYIVFWISPKFGFYWHLFWKKLKF